MAASFVGTEKEICVPIPRIITDPLGSLVTLQALFDTSAMNEKNEAWKYKLHDHNLLCITTNNDGAFALVIRGGSVSFYEKENSLPLKIYLSGKDISTVLAKFCKAIESSLYCEICTKNYGTSTSTEFRYRLQGVGGNIVRKRLDVEHYW